MSTATPLLPTAGWTYFLEAVHSETWPSCPYRFLSYPDSCASVDMYDNVGTNQEWKLIDAGNNYFYLQSSCGNYLSYSGDCTSSVLDQWPEAGVNQQFSFVSEGNTQYQYYVETVGRSGCDAKYLSFPQECATNTTDVIDLWSGAGQNQRFRIFPVRSDNPSVTSSLADTACADPFAYYSTDTDEYYLHCTGGDLDLLSATGGGSLNVNTVFSYVGTSLGGEKPSWAANNDRWAPENYKVGEENYLLFGDSQSDENGVHRIGWSLSATAGVQSGAWDVYSPSYLTLANTEGGEIDSNIFFDSASGNTYILYKSDDNNAGSKTTRIWIQQIRIGGASIEVTGEPVVILDSTGLWWADSFVPDGSLIEGPELIKPEGSEFYYLFFAAGKFCQDSYSEGVARSTSIFGPYEKMGVPLLSTGIVGNGVVNGVTDTGKLVGPGHASFLQGDANEWFAVWHASVGENCARYSFISHMSFGSDGWPFLNFSTTA